MVVAQRVQQLLDLGLLSEMGLGPSSGGRRPRQLTFAPPGHLLVADVGFTSVDVAVTDLNGRLIEHVAEPSDITAGPEAVLSRVTELFDQLRADAGDTGRLWGIGVGIPAPVEFSTGLTVSPPVGHGWDAYPVREYMSERYGGPTWVDKDVNIMMLGELEEGVARGHRDAVFVKCGTGIGLSLVSDGRLHRGALGCAGDLGHLLNLASGHGRAALPRPESASNIWWLAESIEYHAARLAASGASPWLADAVKRGEELTPALVAEAADNGDTASRDLLRSAATLVGTTLATIVSLFNPSLVVIGGGISEAGDYFIAAIREVVYGEAIPLATRDLQVLRAQLGSRAGVVGAAVMVLEQLFNEMNLGSTVGRWLAEA